MLKRIKEALARRKSNPKLRRLRVIETVACLLCLVMLVTTASYAWVRRRWTPVISQDSMQIMSGDSLVFALIGSNLESTIESATMLNDLVNLTDFVFRPVSNLSGKSDDFFALNTDTFMDEYFTHLKSSDNPTPESYTRQGLNNGYIEFTIKVTGRDTSETMQDYTKYVYLSNDTRIVMAHGNSEQEEDGPETDCGPAFRVSVTLKNGMNDERTILFTNSVSGTHRAITNHKNAAGTVWLADGAKYRTTADDPTAELDYAGNYKATQFTPAGYANPIPLVETAAEVHTFDEFMGGYADSNSGPFNKDEVLFAIGPGQTETITIRVWLEGEDANCVGDIMGKFVDFRFGFKSYNVGNTPVTPETTVPEETEEDL